MKNFIVSVIVKLNECEVGVAKVFVRDSTEEFAKSVALNFFSNQYQFEVVEIKEFKRDDE